jgi:pilus assembly protein Flp/PilA
MEESPAPPAIIWSETMLARLAKRTVAFLKREDGPTAVEYAVVLALIIAVIISVSNIGNTTNSSYSNPALQNAAAPPSGS